MGSGPARRGLALGIIETVGYLGVALTALATGYLATAYGLQPAPELLGGGYALAGLGLSIILIRDTAGHARLEANHHPRQAHASADILVDAANTATSGIWCRIALPETHPPPAANVSGNVR